MRMVHVCTCVGTCRLGYGEAELQGVLGWIQDLAPMCVHIHIGTVGRSFGLELCSGWGLAFSLEWTEPFCLFSTGHRQVICCFWPS